MAWGLNDILSSLDRWAEWKRMKEAPAKIDEIERRLLAIEKKLGGKYPADVCRACGAQALRLTATLGPTTKGLMKEEWSCNECKIHESRLVAPSKS